MNIKGDYRIAIYVISIRTTEYIHDIENEDTSVLFPENERMVVIYSEKDKAEKYFDELDIYSFYSMYNLPDICEATLQLDEFILIPDAEAQHNDIIKTKDLLENIDWVEVNNFINKGK